MPRQTELISIVIPLYNESLNIKPFYANLSKVLKTNRYNYEILYVNDGSSDDSLEQLHELAATNSRIRVINLSRNFGKEVATSAGIHHSKGEATIMVDADGQHPVELIPEFIAKWQAGAQVVAGIRKSNQKEGFVKRYGSKIFYRLLKHSTEVDVIPGSSDFRLIDQSVRTEFLKMTERSRITRGMIDWLGFKRDFVYYDANARMAGDATYSFFKLVRLALDSFISLSMKPLYFSVYAGAIILPFSVLLALITVVEMLIGDPLGWNVTGTAYLVMLVLFLIGIMLISQATLALYLSHIHTETKNRPLYSIDNRTSINLE